MTDPNSPTLPRRIKAKEREIEALALRKQGLTYFEIGDRLGVSYQRAFQLVSGALKCLREQAQENTKELLQLQRERLDSMLEVAMERAKVPGVSQAQFIGQAASLLDQKAKLEGLYTEKIKTKEKTKLVIEYKNKPRISDEDKLTTETTGDHKD